MADFDDADPTQEDEFDNEDEEMEDANAGDHDGEADGEQEFDPMVEWLMVENRQSFYEAGRHTLAALQKMMREPSVTLLAMTHRFYALAQADLHLIASFVTETDTC